MSVNLTSVPVSFYFQFELFIRCLTRLRYYMVFFLALELELKGEMFSRSGCVKAHLSGLDFE